MKRIAVLDDKGLLVGDKQVEDDAVLGNNEVDIDPGDLPLNGMFKWMSDVSTFMPLGHGIPLKTKRPPVPDTYAMYLVMKIVHEQLGAPEEVAEYINWYEINLKRRDEERVLVSNRKARQDIALGRTRS